MNSSRRGASSTIAAELLVSTALLFGAALVVAVLTAVLVLPYLASPASATLFLAILLVADLAILFFFLRHLLARRVRRPLERIGKHAERIAEGDYEHRIPATDSGELDRLVSSVNTMAARLIREQRALEENVRSLDRTNRELVETTDQLIHTARMASVGTLAGGIAHEVGNPLGALRGWLDLVRARATSGGDVDEALDVAVEEAGRIDAIIRSILEFVRVGVGGHEWRSADIEAEVREAVGLLERRGALADMRVAIRVESSPPAVRARPQLLEQVLVNLLMNAAQAVEKGGGEPEIEVVIGSEAPPSTPMPPRREGDPPGADYSHRRRLARLREGTPATPELRRGADATIEVRDRGPGIDDDDLERIFDPFFTTRDPGEGTGMGLAITSRIVEELGGELVAENRDGGGALMRVRLPGLGEEAAKYAGETREDEPDPARIATKPSTHEGSPA